MPELPDITVYLDCLQPRILGQVLENVEIVSPFLLRTFEPPVADVEGRTVTGFANVEEDFSDAAAGVTIMPYRVEDELRKRGANYIQAGLFKAFAVRDQNLITGQQQYSGEKVARLVIEALGD